MMEHSHTHHDHNHDPDPLGGIESLDPAGQSLAKALRASFRLLSAIMVLVLAMYLLSGVKTVQSYQVGIKTFLGRVVGQSDQGLAYVWPFPIGGIEIIDMRQRQLGVDDFWMYETSEDKTRDLLSRAGSSSLRPQLDGALLTGDRSLLHVKLNCIYQVVDPRAYAAAVGTLDKIEEYSPVEEMARAAICQAAIRCAATRTADALQRTERDQFALDVARTAQVQLDSLKAGIQISKVLLTNASWPIEALRTYIDAQNAVSQAEKLKSDARAEAEKILNAAAGASYRKLVTDPEQTDPASRSAANSGSGNLIGLYVKALASSDTAKAAQLLDAIDEVLLSNETGGDASRILAEARGYRTATIQRVKSRAERFNELLPEFRQTSELMLQRLWAATREEILNSPTVEKFYLSFGDDKTVLRINRDPDVVNQILKELKAAKQPKSPQ